MHTYIIDRGYHHQSVVQQFILLIVCFQNSRWDDTGTNLILGRPKSCWRFSTTQPSI